MSEAPGVLFVRHREAPILDLEMSELVELLALMSRERLRNGRMRNPRRAALAVLDHLRLCAAIPESYGHDSSEEKLYSKYTDAVISVASHASGVGASSGQPGRCGRRRSLRSQLQLGRRR